MRGPQWSWDLLGDGDEVLDRPMSPAFTSRFDAESWLGEHWRDLSRQHVRTARLMHRGSSVAQPVAFPSDPDAHPSP